MVLISCHGTGRATTLLNLMLILVEMGGNLTVVHLRQALRPSYDGIEKSTSTAP